MRTICPIDTRKRGELGLRSRQRAGGFGGPEPAERNLVLCDINMPAMDGLEFVKQLPSVENARGVPVVMITTEGSEGHVVQALSAGAHGSIAGARLAMVLLSIDKGSLIETLINGSSRRNFLSNSSAYEITCRSADLCGAWNRLRRCVRP